MSDKKQKKERIAILPDGKKLPVVGEDGRYWLCGKDGGRRFRKANVQTEERAVTETKKKPSGEKKNEK